MISFSLVSQKFNDDVIAHGKDIERAKQAGKDLADAQDIVKNDVQKALGKSNIEKQNLVIFVFLISS